MKIIAAHFRRPFVAIVVSCAALVSSEALGATSQVAIDSLSTISPVAVYVGELPDWVSANGVTRQSIKENVELLLHNEGVTIAATAKEAGADIMIVVEGKRVTIQNVDHLPFVYYYTSTLSVFQKVRLINSGKDSMGTTWYSEQAGFVSSSTKAAVDGVLSSINKNTSKFLTDYKSANKGTPIH